MQPTPDDFLPPASAGIAAPASQYRVGDLWVMRMAGFAVEDVKAIVSPQLALAFDRLLAAEERCDAVAERLGARLGAMGPSTRRLRRKVARRNRVDAADADAEIAALIGEYHAALDETEAASAALPGHYEAERSRLAPALLAFATSERFRHVLLLSSPGLEARLLPRADAPPWRRRALEASWASYLQRLTTKNDTVSFFGPCAWGRVDRAADRVVSARLGETLARHAYLERWVCLELARAMAQDQDVRPLLRPRVVGDVLLLPERVERLSRGESMAIDGSTHDLLRRCDGTTPLGALDADAVEALARASVLTVEVPVPCSGDPLSALREEVRSWPEGAARARWDARLTALELGRTEFERADGVEARRQALGRMAEALAACGAAASRSSSALYAARLPLNESCALEAVDCVAGGPLLDQVEHDLAPWYELWRDLCGAYAAGLLEALAPLWHQCRAGTAPIRLPQLIAAAERAGIPLARSAGIGVPRKLEARLQQAWTEQLGARVEAAELQLTEDDLSFVRRRFPVRRLRGFDWPAPDVQLAAASEADLRAGRWRLVLGEIHRGMSLWHNCFYHWCPDKPRLTGDYIACRMPAVLEFAASGEFDGPVHTIGMAPLHLPDWTFTHGLDVEGAGRIASAEVTVELVEDDLILRDAAGRRLGSLLDNWLVPRSVHRLELLGEGPHSPRLLCGRVVVQRRSWRVASESAVPSGPRTTATDTMLALRRLRRRRDMPEELFVKPMLPLSGTDHPDAKPMFIDLRSPFLVELLVAMMKRYREIRFAEMLPSTDQCWLEGPDGHYSCELRMMTRPAIGETRDGR